MDYIPPTAQEFEESLERTNEVVNDLTVKLAELEYDFQVMMHRLFPLEFADERPYVDKFFDREKASGSAWPEEFVKAVKKDFVLE